MTEIVVTTQEELVKALNNADIRIIRIKASKDFNIPYGKWEEKGKRILVYGRATVEAHGDASVTAYDYASVTAWGETTVVAHGDASVTAYNLVSVEAYGRATVELCLRASVTAHNHVRVIANDFSSVTAYDFTSVTARGCASVTARGCATVEADDRAKVMAGAYVPVHILSEQVSVVGGMQILVEPTKTISPKQWCGVNIITVDDDGMAHLYKAVGEDGRSPRGGLYIVGDTTDDTEHWLDNRKCGRGLHASPTPKMAREYFKEAVRFFEVTCPVEDLRPIDNTKCKAPRLHVVREVDIDGNPIDGEGDRR